MFKKGDRVLEDRLTGTVTKMHKNGAVVDVLFDGEEYARRRQVGDVMKLRQNSKFGKISAKPAIKSVEPMLKKNPKGSFLKSASKVGATAFKGAKKAGKAIAKQTKIAGIQALILKEEAAQMHLFTCGKKLEISPSQVKATKEYKKTVETLKILKQSLKVAKAQKNPRKPKYTTHLPLIIGCGASKNPGKLPANEKYAKGYWATYRANTPSMPNQDAATYVLSAKYGIIPETQEITSYDKVIVPSSKRSLARNEVKASTVAKKLAKQLDPQPVILVGGSAYAEALELAGFTPIMVENLSEFPGKKIRGGMGKKNKALKWFISDFLPSRRSITPQRVRSRRKGATTSSVVANLDTQDGIVKTLYHIRVNGIYKGEVRRALGLRSNASFGKGRKRLDLRLPRAERRKLLNLAFGAATQAMRKEGMLAKSGSKNMYRLSKNKFKLLVDKNQSRNENYYTSRIAEFEKALDLTRKTK